MDQRQTLSQYKLAQGLALVHQTQTLSQYKLANFLACQRRFQLRTLRRLPWPASPLPERTEQLLQQGQDFHQLLERHFLGLPITQSAIPNGRIQQWWQAFNAHSPVKNLPDSAHFLPETGLTVPLGNHLLCGRFDLLVIGEDAKTNHLPTCSIGKPAVPRRLMS